MKRFLILLFMVTLLAGCSTAPGTEKPSPEFATVESPAVSPSGKYTLVVVYGYDGIVHFQSFQILNQRGEGVYASTERFRTRDRTYFLWGEGDRVWVYSGDVGIFVWERDSEEDTGAFESAVAMEKWVEVDWGSEGSGLVEPESLERALSHDD